MSQHRSLLPYPNLTKRRTAEAKALLNGAAVTEYMMNQSEIIKGQSDYMMLAEASDTDRVNILLQVLRLLSEGSHRS